MRRWYVWLTVSVVLLGLLVWRTKPWEALATGADWRLLAVVVALNGLVIAMWAIRSGRLMAAVGHPLPVASLVPVVSFANTINNLTPASTGEALRAVILRRRHGVPYGPSTAVILAERFWAIWIMAVTAGAAAVGTIVPASPPLVVLAWIAAIVASFAPSFTYRAGLRPISFAARFVEPPQTPPAAEPPGSPAREGPAADAPPPSRRQRVAATLRTVDESLASIAATPSVVTSFVLSTAVVFVTTSVQLWLILVSLGEPIPLVAAWAALGLATIAGVISALPFGLGAADVVMTGLLTILGVPASAAAAAALLLRATVTLPLGLAGTGSWIALNRGVEAQSATGSEP
jgi:uncharacterized membrane protein YbhN (UPF0104 family)